MGDMCAVVVVIAPATNPCDAHPCQNGGTCNYNNVTNTYHCDCDKKYKGIHCQHSTYYYFYYTTTTTTNSTTQPSHLSMGTCKYDNVTDNTSASMTRNSPEYQYARHTAASSGQGRSDGGYIGIYTPQISLP